PPTISTPTGKEPPRKPKPSELEQMLAEALAHNPDIRVAEAKLREAEAELNRVRLQVLQKESTLYHAAEAQKATMGAVEGSLQTTAGPDRERASIILAQERAKLASLEAEVPGVLGRPPHSAATDKTGADTGGWAPILNYSQYLNQLG